MRRKYEQLLQQFRKAQQHKKVTPRLPALLSKSSSKTTAKTRPGNAAAAKAHYTIQGLMVAYFALRLGEVVEKAELIEFLRRMRVSTVDPQPRHLGMQNGFDFLVAGCMHPRLKRRLKRGQYCLMSLRANKEYTGPTNSKNSKNSRKKAGGAKDSPGGRRGVRVGAAHRVVTLTAAQFAALKRRHGMRCALCGSREGEPHFKNGRLVTRLEKGHMDPRKELTAGNCLPTCSLCNGVYRNKAVFNRNGFVRTWLGAS